MQRADRAHSATGDHASPDNVTRTIIRIELQQAHMSRVLGMADQSHFDISAIRTLLLAATEAVEALEAEDDRNITPVYVRYRAAHMNALLGMLDTYLDRIDDGVHATLNVLRDNIQRVAA